MNAFHLKMQLQLHTTAYRRVPVTTHTQKQGGREGGKPRRRTRLLVLRSVE